MFKEPIITIPEILIMAAFIGFTCLLPLPGMILVAIILFLNIPR